MVVVVVVGVVVGIGTTPTTISVRGRPIVVGSLLYIRLIVMVSVVLPRVFTLPLLSFSVPVSVPLSIARIVVVPMCL